MKCTSYFLLLLANQFFVAALGGYSSVKNEVGEELGFSISFLGSYFFIAGVLEMISMIGRLVASFFIVVFPPTKINKTFFLSTLLQTLSVVVMVSSHFLQSVSK